MDYVTMEDVAFEHQVGVPFTIAFDRSKAQADLQLGIPDVARPPQLPMAKRVAHSAEDWKPFRALVQELWIDKNLNFKQVAAVLAEEHNFHITKRQFDRITKRWGMQKYIRKEDMMVIVQTRQERANRGKTTVVRIHGQELSGAKISRWQQRHKDVTELTEIDHSADPPVQHIEFSPRNPPEEGQSHYYLYYSNVGVLDSPKLRRMIKAIKDDSNPDGDNIPPLDLDSCDGHFFQADQPWDVRDASLQETSTLVVLRNWSRSTRSPEASYVQTSYGMLLASEISPFPPSALTISPMARKVISTPGLPYKHVEEMRYRHKLWQLRQQSDRVDTPEYLETLLQLMDVFLRQGRYSDAQRNCWAVFQIREKLLGYEHKDTLHVARSLAYAILYQGKYAEAEPHIRRLYEAAPRILGPDHEITLDATMMMSNIALKFGNVQEMRRLAREVLQICLQTFGPRDEFTILAICHLSEALDPNESRNLCRIALDICKNGGEDLQEAAFSAAWGVASALRNLERKQESLDMFRDLLKRSIDLYGPGNHMSLQFQSEICYSLIFVNKYADAERLSRKTFLQYRKISSPNVHDSLNTMAIYGLALENLKRYPEAEQRFIKVIDALENLCGKFNHDSVAVIENLGDLFEEQKRLDDAIALYTQKHKEFEEARVENTVGSKILFLLARTLYIADRFEDAAVSFRKLIDMQIRLLGETHNETLVYYEWLGDCYADLSQWNRQVAVYQDKHERLQNSAVENELTLRIWYLLAKSLHSAQRFEESAKCFIDLIERQESVLGIEDDTVIKTYKRLGDVYNEDKRYDEEIAHYQAKLEQLRSFAFEKEATFRVWYLLGVAFFSAGRLEEAGEYLQALLRRQEEVLGATHKRTIDTYEFLGDCYHKAERLDDHVALYQRKRDQLLDAGDETEQSLRIFFLLPWSLFKAEKYLDAATHFKVLIEKQERLLGQTHKNTLGSYCWLTECYREEDRYDDILVFYVEKMDIIRSAKAGDEQFCTLLKRLSLILYRTGFIKYARAGLEVVVDKLEQLFGEQHLAALEAKVWLGSCHERQRRYVAALATYEAALEGFVRLKVTMKETDESLVTLLLEDISKMKEHIANGKGEDVSSDEEDSGEESEENNDSGSNIAWEDYVDMDGLEALIPAEFLMF